MTNNQPQVIKGTYKHFKGNLYRILDFAYHSETKEKYVVYLALYDDFKVYIRPFDMFFEDVERNGKIFPRFEYLDEYSNQK